MGKQLGAVHEYHMRSSNTHLHGLQIDHCIHERRIHKSGNFFFFHLFFFQCMVACLRPCFRTHLKLIFLCSCFFQVKSGDLKIEVSHTTQCTVCLDKWRVLSWTSLLWHMIRKSLITSLILTRDQKKTILTEIMLHRTAQLPLLSFSYLFCCISNKKRPNTAVVIFRLFLALHYLQPIKVV